MYLEVVFCLLFGKSELGIFLLNVFLLATGEIHASCMRCPCVCVCTFVCETKTESLCQFECVCVCVRARMIECVCVCVTLLMALAPKQAVKIT